MTAKGKAYHFKNQSKYLTEKINQADVPFIQANNELQKQLKVGTLPPKDKIRSFTPHTLLHGFANKVQTKARKPMARITGKMIIS